MRLRFEMQVRASRLALEVVQRQYALPSFCPSLERFSFSTTDQLTRSDGSQSVTSAGALGARPGALGRPRCRHGEPLGARLELRLRNLS